MITMDEGKAGEVKARVKVLRSERFNNFEVELETTCSSDAEVDLLRKRAQRLVDKAVDQYQRARQEANLMVYVRNTLLRVESVIAPIIAKGESVTERERSLLGNLDILSDFLHEPYDYGDDPEEETVITEAMRQIRLYFKEQDENLEDYDHDGELDRDFYDREV